MVPAQPPNTPATTSPTRPRRDCWCRRSCRHHCSSICSAGNARRPKGLPRCYAARDSGTGCYREVALADAAHALAAPLRYGLTGAGAPLGGGSPTYHVYRTSDGHVALAAVELQFARRVGELLGPAEGWAELLAARSAAYWVRWAAQHDLPLVEVHPPPQQVRAHPVA